MPKTRKLTEITAWGGSIILRPAESPFGRTLPQKLEGIANTIQITKIIIVFLSFASPFAVQVPQTLVTAAVVNHG